MGNSPSQMRHNANFLVTKTRKCSIERQFQHYEFYLHLASQLSVCQYMSHKTPPTALQKGMDFLTRRSYSVAGMKKKLLEKNFSLQDTDAAIERLQELGFLNDAEFARGIIRAHRSKGNHWLRLKLKQEGVVPEIIEEMISDIDDEAQRIMTVLARKAASLRESDPHKRREKLYRFLASRGFGVDSIKRVLKELQPD